MVRDQATKQERVLNAAQTCFSLYGFKRTTMDDIAQQAAISRPALYLLFPNKEALFRSLSAELHHAALVRAEAALQAEGSVEQRLVAAFEGRDLGFIDLVERSAHGVELVDTKHSIGADIAEHAERRFTEVLAQALEQAARQGELTFERIGFDAAACAELLILAVSGVNGPRPSLAQYRQRVPHLIRVFCTALATTRT